MRNTIIIGLILSFVFISCKDKQDNVVTKSINKKVDLLKQAKKNTANLEKNTKLEKKIIDEKSKKKAGVDKEEVSDFKDEEFYKVNYKVKREINKLIFIVKAEVKEPHHINMDFPISLRIKKDGLLKLEKNKFSKEDLTSIAKHTFTFRIEASVENIPDKLEGDLRFAHCTKDTCNRVKDEFSLELK